MLHYNVCAENDLNHEGTEATMIFIKRKVKGVNNGN